MTLTDCNEFISVAEVSRKVPFKKRKASEFIQSLYIKCKAEV